MPLDAAASSIAVVALSIAVGGLVLWVALLQRAQARLVGRLRRILGDGAPAGLDAVLDSQGNRIDALGGRVDALSIGQQVLDATTRRTLQKVGVVRFNPFADSGGDQSFVIALLDQAGSGIVISSLHGRAGTRVFAKEVADGRSTHALSDEEQQAIRAAGA